MNQSEYKLAFVDLETTGLCEQENEIIEIGALIYDPTLDQVTKEWETKVAPTRIETASEDALRINGYINNPGLYTGKLKSALIKFNSLVKGCKIVGQNIEFDLKFLYKNMKEFDIEPSFSRRDKLELMSLAWWAVKDTEIPGVGLKHFCSHFGVTNVGAHTALVDCRRAYEVYRKLSELYK